MSSSLSLFKFASYFIAPLLGYLFGLASWELFGAIARNPNAMIDHFGLLGINQTTISEKLGIDEALRVANITMFFLAGVAVQFSAGLVYAFRAFWLRVVMRDSSLKSPSVGQVIVVFLLFCFLVWSVFVSPPNTIDDGKLGKFAVLTDFRFFSYFAIFSILNVTLILLAIVALDFGRWIFISIKNSLRL
jgi:hypothetical protein